jgi:uncharacterized protein YutE (UPF0331/DUF86 family)
MIEGLSVANGKETADRERLLKPSERIYDLVDVVPPSVSVGEPAGKRTIKRDVIYDLVDVIETKPKMAVVDTGLHDEIMRRAVEIAERIAREVVPDIAERVIREEIEKIKKGS